MTTQHFFSGWLQIHLIDWVKQRMSGVSWLSLQPCRHDIWLAQRRTSVQMHGSLYRHKSLCRQTAALWKCQYWRKTLLISKEKKELQSLEIATAFCLQPSQLTHPHNHRDHWMLGFSYKNRVDSTIFPQEPQVKRDSSATTTGTNP